MISYLQALACEYFPYFSYTDNVDRMMIWLAHLNALLPFDLRLADYGIEKLAIKLSSE